MVFEPGKHDCDNTHETMDEQHSEIGGKGLVQQDCDLSVVCESREGWIHAPKYPVQSALRHDIKTESLVSVCAPKMGILGSMYGDGVSPDEYLGNVQLGDRDWPRAWLWKNCVDPDPYP